MVFILAQFFVVLFLERIRIQARCIEEIAQALVVHGRIATVQWDSQTESEEYWVRRAEATKEFGRLAALLEANAQTLKWYPLWQAMGLVIPYEQAIIASENLTILSTHCYVSAMRNSTQEEFDRVTYQLEEVREAIEATRKALNVHGAQ